MREECTSCPVAYASGMSFTPRRRKLLVASVGVATMSFIGCGDSNARLGNATTGPPCPDGGYTCSPCDRDPSECADVGLDGGSPSDGAPDTRATDATDAADGLDSADDARDATDGDAVGD